MPTVFSHAAAGLAVATVVRAPGSGGRLALLGALCAAAPDLDVVAICFGVPWGHVFGHRGITHSLSFAAILAAVLSVALVRGSGRLGVAFFAPFDDARYFLPWRPFPVSPISASRFFSERGLAIVRAGVLLIWLPAAILLLVTLGWRRRGGRG